jgi:hypothetical protein
METERKKLFSNIVFIGLVSFFVDMSTEMVYPLIPLFLTATLGATPAIVGIIEGIADSIASLLKVFSGYMAMFITIKRSWLLPGIRLPLFIRWPFSFLLLGLVF